MKHFLVLSFLLLTACTVVSEPIAVTRVVATAVATPTTPALSHLEGTEWQLIRWGNRQLLPDTVITLLFATAEEVGGFVNCRHYTGNYIVENAVIHFPNLSMDPSECDQTEATLSLEAEFTTTFSQITQFRWQDGQLELLTEQGELLLFGAPLPEEALSSQPIGAVPTALPPAPTPADQPSLTLGQPHMVGRGQIMDAAFTPDGTGVAVAWANGVSFTAVADASEQWWQPIGSSLLALDMRPDGQAIAAITGNGFLLVLTLADAHFQSYPIARANAYWGDVAWSPDGSQIAASFIGPNRADPIYIFEATTEITTEVPDSQGSAGTEPYLVWSPDGKAITLASLSETCAHILDVQTGERLFSLQYDKGRCYATNAVAWSPDGRFLTLNSPNNTLDTIEIASQTVRQSIPGNSLTFSPIQAGQPLFYSADGRWLASKGGFGFYNDGYPLQVWAAATGQPAGQMETTTPNHRLVSSFAGETLLSLYADGTLTRWAFASGATEEDVLGKLPVYVVRYLFVWSPDGRKIATPTDNQSVIWDVAAAQPIAAFDISYAITAFSHDSRLVALIDPATNELILYDLDNQTITQTFTEGTAAVETVAFAPDGRSLAYGSGNEVVIVDVATGVETAVLTGYPADQTITQIIWSPTGRALVAASALLGGGQAPGTMIVWGRTAVGEYNDLFRAENIRTDFLIHTRPIILFNPSGTLVALENLPRAAVGQFTIFVYDMEQQELILEFDDYQLSGWEADELLLTSEEQYDTWLTQWDVRTGVARVGQVNDNGGPTFAPRGGFYAQPNGTGEAINRRVEVGHWQSNLLRAQAPLNSDIGQIVWSPDGRFLAASASDGTLTVWPVNSGQ